MPRFDLFAAALMAMNPELAWMYQAKSVKSLSRYRYASCPRCTKRTQQIPGRGGKCHSCFSKTETETSEQGANDGR